MRFAFPVVIVMGVLSLLIYGSGGASSFFANILSTQGGYSESINLDASSPHAKNTASQKINKSSEKRVPLSKVAPCALKAGDVPTYSPVIINEVAWMGSEGDTKKEWIELRNISTSSISLQGWEMRDKTANIDVRMSGVSIAPGEFYVLRRGVDFVGTINNSDESLSLYNAQCVLMDSVVANSSWPAGDSKNELTAERGGDDGWYASTVRGGTPGAENSVLTTNNKQPTTNTGINNNKQLTTTTEQTTHNIQPATSTNIANNKQPSTSNGEQIANNIAQMGEVRISEVMTGKNGNANFDFIELYNNSDVSVTLTDWSVKKKSSTGKESTLVSASRLDGKIIPPHKHFLLAGGGYSGSPIPDVVWPNSYTLSGMNNGVILYMKPTPVDAVEWDSINENESIVREGWDTSSYRREVNPSPQNTQSQ